MEEEKIEEMKPNMYNTLYECAVDVMDEVREDSFFSVWNGNEFFYLLNEEDENLYTSEKFESYILKHLSDKDSWDKTTNKSIVVVHPYSFHNFGIESIKPDAVVFVTTGKYDGDETDISEFWQSNIFYYGENPDRFIRFFKKFGLAVKL